MVQLTIDTNNDPLPELEEAAQILAQAIARRKGAAPAAPHAQPAPEPEVALDTPFLKITMKADDEEPAQAPTLNELLNDKSLTDDEMHKLFSEQQALDAEHEAKEPRKEKKKKASEDDAYIEIIEFDDEQP